jgi:hypothetical protein
MAITLKDSNDVEYTFNSTFMVKGFSWKKRTKQEDIAFSHGSKDTGDGKIDARAIIVKGIIHADTTAEYETAMADLNKALYKEDQKLYFDNTKYINVYRVESISHENKEGAFLYVAEIEIKFEAIDPFFYYFTQSIDFQFIETSPHQFNINNSGNVEVFPVMGMTTRVTNADFTFKNITAGLSFSYQDAGFVAGSTLIIDCQEGTVKRDDTDEIRYFDGEFLHLVSGVNVLEYAGATICGLSILFYRREL